MSIESIILYSLAYDIITLCIRAWDKNSSFLSCERTKSRFDCIIVGNGPWFLFFFLHSFSHFPKVKESSWIRKSKWQHKIDKYNTYNHQNIRPTKKEKKGLSHKPELISMWTHFCRIALRAKPNFLRFFFFLVAGKNEQIGHNATKKKKKKTKNTIKNHSCLLHCSFSKKRKKKHSTQLFWVKFVRQTLFFFFFLFFWAWSSR